MMQKSVGNFYVIRDVIDSAACVDNDWFSALNRHQNQKPRNADFTDDDKHLEK